MKSPPKIAAAHLTKDERLFFLQGFFNFSQIIRVEAMIYGWMTKLSVDYIGGIWDFFKLDNGGFYMAPTQYNQLRMQSKNGLEIYTNNDAAGIVATLATLNHMCKEIQSESILNIYLALFEFANEHVDRDTILSVASGLICFPYSGQFSSEN